MILTDTHTHIYYSAETEELYEAINLCATHMVERMFLACIDAKSAGDIYKVCAEFPEKCFPTLGLHPCEVKENYVEQIQLLKQWYNKLKPCAIGEIGIDLYWDATYKNEQIEAFKIQIEWALEKQLSINIHCRNAFDEVFEVLNNYKNKSLKGILHCFSGNLDQAKKIIDFGLFLGIGGVVTYKNAGLDKVVAELSLENLVLETDAPYLAPHPYRGKPNQTAYVFYVAEKLSKIFNVSLEEVAYLTTLNSKKVFGV